MQGFPVGDYTPFGYISNHAQFARSWNEVYGGTLRTALRFPGFGWVYPTERRPAAGVAVGAGLVLDGRAWLTRDDLKESLRSPYHSANIFAYAYEVGAAKVEFRAFGASPNVLAGYVEVCAGERPEGREAGREAGPQTGRETGGESDLPRSAALAILLEGYAENEEVAVTAAREGDSVRIEWRRTESARAAERALPPARRTYGRPFLNVPDDLHELAVHAPGCKLVGVFAADSWEALRHQIEAWSKERAAADPSQAPRRAAATASGIVVGAALFDIGAGGVSGVGAKSRTTITLALRRHPSFTAGGRSATAPWETEKAPLYPLPLEHFAATYEKKLEEDAAFWDGAPRLEGDWPLAWKNGFVYDFETTRMCTFPPMGVFRDVWPSWMASYPRVVLAEGSLDMMRLAYADPGVAKRAILSMFRDTWLDNVPCIHAEGQPNMVAKDGSICGTSPAWCMPFFSIYLVYLRTLDKKWLAELFPYLARYTEWWLTYRTDKDGWVNYKCTWEAGEDCSTRLDPEGTGDSDISGVVRPVETQAAMAHCCYVLRAFARELGREDEAAEWAGRYEEFVRRTRALFDPQAGRFRDFDLRTDTFLDDSGPPDYWGANPRRHSVLSLTALLFGIASPEQVEAMAGEVPHYGNPPWCYWPSWTYVAQEAATAIGLHAWAGENAARIVSRVYRDSDRREFGDYPRGFPGVAREYWPKLEDFKGSDAYGWGAHTAVLVIRQIAGFQESERTDRREFHLAPSFAGELAVLGRRYGLVNVHYRGERFDLWYALRENGRIQVEVRFGRPVGLRVTAAAERELYAQDAAACHSFSVDNASRVTVVIL